MHNTVASEVVFAVYYTDCLMHIPELTISQCVLCQCSCSPLQLVALLREVKYLEQMDGSEHVIPASASSVFEKNETYRSFLQVGQHTSLLPRNAV